MIDFFDTLGNTLNDIVNSHPNNNMGWAGQQVFGYAEGGEVTDTVSTPGVLQALATAGKQTMNNSRQDTSYIGGNFINSPTYMMQHYSQLGKFFTGAEPGNLYTNRYKSPEPSKPPVAENPNDFYARWYMSMRRFAEAEEVASRGQPQVRSK